MSGRKTNKTKEIAAFSNVDASFRYKQFQWLTNFCVPLACRAYSTKF